MNPSKPHYCAARSIYKEAKLAPVRVSVYKAIGDGLFEIRTDNAGTGGDRTDVTQRVSSVVDNGPVYRDHFIETAVNFHQAHGHIHLENFSEFQLLQAVTHMPINATHKTRQTMDAMLRRRRSIEGCPRGQCCGTVGSVCCWEGFLVAAQFCN